MFTHRVKEWLADHPMVLNAAFTVMVFASETDLDPTTGGGADSYLGP